MVCVRPGVLLTNASFLRAVIALIALDLPALERPANAISQPTSGGSSVCSCADATKWALLKSDIDSRGREQHVAPKKPRTIQWRLFRHSRIPKEDHGSTPVSGRSCGRVHSRQRKCPDCREG